MNKRNEKLWIDKQNFFFFVVSFFKKYLRVPCKRVKLKLKNKLKPTREFPQVILIKP